MEPQHEEITKGAQTTVPISFLAEAKNKNQLLPAASLHLIKKHHESKVMPEQSPTSEPSSISCPLSLELSTVDIIKMARKIGSGDLSYVKSAVSPENYKDFELALLLQAAAFNFSNQQFVHARNLLSICQGSASLSGNPIQRVVYYFVEALQEKITMETEGEVLQEKPEGNQRDLTIEEAFLSLHPALMECHAKLPFCRITQFTAIQAILDNVGSAKRIHLIDLGIKCGTQWSVLMQALANRHECPLELLKITAVGPSKEMIEEIGKQLSSFAASLNIPFAFRIVVSDLQNVDQYLFQLAANEVVAIYSELRLASLLAWPHHLESLLSTIKKLRPRVMVMIEIEANTNAPLFMDRFNASLSVSAALFDCLESCMDRDSPSRAIIEGMFLREGIQYLITSRGKESIHRQESIGFWRAFLKRFGMVEITLSNWAFCQANLVAKSNPCWSSCTLEVNGKGMTIGWKGTPIHMLSVWKC
ncbi:DELLA protein RGL2-like [Coffea eugenioides]|uniref:DELLA protein RGL2-like n=1 Tax=Coffea eugenioides TaxID=49369 RepID=UPI000F614C18|nr:DELLA protein RGL2-like [Coffea eugenioides]